ncbi:MAG: polysaccharide deacetylase, partial [Longicatena sp.]
YGSKNDTVISCAHNKRVVAWTLDTRDWASKNAKTVVDNVMNTVKDGDVILMHDLYASSAQAATIIIPKLKEAGYQLVTVSELYTYHPNLVR